MDSWAKSAAVGRISGPIAVGIAAVMTLAFGIEIDEETMELGVNSTVSFLNGLLAFYGFAMAIRSKIRQKQMCVCEEEVLIGCGQKQGEQEQIDQKVEDKIREMYRNE